MPFLAVSFTRSLISITPGQSVMQQRPIMAAHFMELIGVLALGFLLCAFCYVYVAHEDPAYLWDYGAYFEIYRSYGKSFTSVGSDWFARLAGSIMHDDYNASFVVPLLPVYVAFGDSRTAYIFGTVLLYLIPSALLSASLVANAITEKDELTVERFTLTVLAALFYWPFWEPTLRGFPDVVGLLPLGVATLLMLRSRFLTVDSFRNAFRAGLLIWLAFLLRRWYAFAAIGLIVSSGLFCLLRIYGFAGDRRRYCWRAVIGFATILVLIVGCLAIFQRPLAIRILTTDYNQIYAAYQQPLVLQIYSIYETLGPLICAVAAIGTAFAVRARNVTVLFGLCASVITFFLFSRTQAPGTQHMLPICFWIFPAFGYGLICLFRSLPNLIRRMSMAVVFVLLLASFASVFSQAVRNDLAFMRAMVPVGTFFPLKIQNFGEYKRLIADIHRLVGNSEKFAVFASSSLMSDSLLQAIDPTLSQELALVSHIDLIHGMRLDTLRAKFALVTDPVTFHGALGSQKVITVPAERILEGVDFGMAYNQVAGPYFIAGGLKAYLYQRTRPLNDSEVNKLVEDFQKSYPKWRLDGDKTIH